MPMVDLLAEESSQQSVKFIPEWGREPKFLSKSIQADIIKDLITRRPEICFGKRMQIHTQIERVAH